MAKQKTDIVAPVVAVEPEVEQVQANEAEVQPEVEEVAKEVEPEVQPIEPEVQAEVEEAEQEDDEPEEEDSDSDTEDESEEEDEDDEETLEDRIATLRAGGVMFKDMFVKTFGDITAGLFDPILNLLNAEQQKIDTRNEPEIDVEAAIKANQEKANAELERLYGKA